MRKLGKGKKTPHAQSVKVNRHKISVPGWSKKNNGRAANAERALLFYLKSEHDPATAVCALLSDLRHYCDACKVNLAEQDGIACRNYAGQVLELI